jgi:hypothetical protein
MDITVITLKILAIYLVVSGLFLIIKGKTVPHLLHDFFDHPATVYLTGIILIFLSSMYLIQYNIWTGAIETTLTVFAWLIGIKGLLYIFFPRMLEKMAKKFRGFFAVYGFIAIVIGAYILFYVK